MHLRRRALKESSTSLPSQLANAEGDHSLITADEERVPREDNPVIPILHEPANTVLGMAWRMQRLDGNALPDLEGLLVSWSAGDGLAVLAAEDRQSAELRQLKKSSTFDLKHRSNSY